MKQVCKQGLFILYVLCTWGALHAQDLRQAKFRLTAQKAAENEIKIDGNLAENVWQQAEKTTPFWESKPNDKDLAKTQTTAQIAYDSKYLYIAARIEGSNLVSQTRKRDTSFQVGFKEWFNRFDYFIRPKDSKINTITLTAWDSQVWNPEYIRTDHVIDFSADVEFKNRSRFLFKINYSNINLPYAFDISENLRVDKAEYHFPKMSLQYSSSNIKPFYYTLNLGTGEYYGAKINTLKFNLNYRVQPWGNFSLISEYNQISLKGITENILLISPKTEINFSNNLFWTTFFQYNTQANNFNINSRLQWRYRPMSDFYLVYTDNYTASPFFDAKNRALVFKMSYWLNL